MAPQSKHRKRRRSTRSHRDYYIDLWTILRYVLPLSRAPHTNLTDRNLPEVRLIRDGWRENPSISIDTYIHTYPPLRLEAYPENRKILIVPGKFYSLFIVPIREPPAQHFTRFVEEHINEILRDHDRWRDTILKREFEEWRNEGEFLFGMLASKMSSKGRGIYTQIYLPKDIKMKNIEDLISLAKESLGRNDTGLAFIWAWGRPIPSPRFILLVDPHVSEDLERDGKVGAGYHLSGSLFVLGRRWAEKIADYGGKMFGWMRMDFFSTEDSFYQVYKAYSLIKTIISLGKGVEEFRLSDDRGNLAKLRFHNDMRIIRGVYATIISLKTNFGHVHSPPLYLKEGPGYRIVEGHGIEIQLDREEMRHLIRGMLLSDKELFAILLLKYKIITELREDGGNYQLDRIANLFIILSRDEEIHDTLTDKNGKNLSYLERIAKDIEESLQNPEGFLLSPEGDGFLDFSIDVLMHTLAHSMMNFLSLRYGASPGMLFYAFTSLTDDLRTSDILREDGKDLYLTLVIAEDSEGGFGITESLLSDIRDGTVKNEEILRDMLWFLLTEHGDDLCMDTWQNHVKAIRQDPILSKILNKYKDFRIRLREIEKKLRRKYGVGIPIEFVRQMIIYDNELQNIVHRMKEDTRVGKIQFKDVGALLPPLIDHEIPYCWDGCLGCIRNERGCSLQPYDQIFSLSKRLLVKFLNALTSSRPSFQKSGKRMGDIILKELSDAKRIVRIVSPFFTPEVLDQVADPLLNRGVEVRLVISRQKKLKDVHIEHLNKKVAESGGLFKYRLISDEFVHMKAYIVDDASLITGSVNLTWGGFYENREHLQITRDKVEIYKRISEFEELMRKED